MRIPRALQDAWKPRGFANLAQQGFREAAGIRRPHEVSGRKQFVEVWEVQRMIELMSKSQRP
jgi:hypothetical protein